MKRILIVFFETVLLINVAAQTTFRSGDYYYKTTSDSTVEVSGVEGIIDTIRVPSSVSYMGGAYTVNAVGIGAFDFLYTRSIFLPPTVKKIGGGAFSNSTYLGYVNIPEGVTSIEANTFYHCPGLLKLTLPPSITSIGQSAFGACSGLDSLTIPSSVTYIGPSAFEDCTGLKTMTIPFGVTKLENFLFEGCTNLSSLTIPSSVTSLGIQIFYGCTKLSTITLPTSITSIGEQAFMNWYGLTSIIIPSSVTTIYSEAFSGCTGLKTVTIPSSVKSIYAYAFFYCIGLTEVYCQLATPLPSAGYLFYYASKSTCKLYVPVGSSALYAAATEWKDFTTIIEEGTTPITTLNSSLVKVFADQLELVIKDAPLGETITVFTLSGVPVKTVKATAEVRIPIPSRQAYLVRVGSETFKVGL